MYYILPKKKSGCPRLALGEGALGGALGEALGGPWAVSLGRWSWTRLGRALGGSLASALNFSENEQPLRTLGKALGAALGGPWAEQKCGRVFPRGTKDTQRAPNSMDIMCLGREPWADLACPRLTRDAIGPISPRLCPRLFIGKSLGRPWAAQGNFRKNALGGLGGIFF